jgi:hypothetical protein
VYCTRVPDYIVVVHYCTVVVLQIVSHCYIVVVLETVTRDYTMVDVRCYTATPTQIVLLHVHHAPYMYLQSFLSSSPRLNIPCIDVQLTCKHYKMYSLVLSNTSTLEGSDWDHSRVF